MKTRVLLTLMLLVILAAGCSSTRGTEPEAQENVQATSAANDNDANDNDANDNESGNGTVLDRAGLIDALRQAGATVEEGGVVEDPFFATDAQFITVNGTQVQVYEFADEATREAAQETVNAVGNIIGSITVDWTEQPNFFGSGRLIVLYVGEDEAILDLLSEPLGEPAIQGDVIFVVPSSAAVEAGVAALAEELAMAADEISVVSVEGMDWTDGCLGLGGPDEGCLAVIVPGFRIVVEVGEKQFEIRTDSTGEVVRWQELE
jgi:hypothetical protein